MIMLSNMYFPLNNNTKISGAIILGPRVDRFRDDESKYIAGHSIPLISLGGFILTFGFMAFNAGSQVIVLDMNFFYLMLFKYFFIFVKCRIVHVLLKSLPRCQ